MISVEMKLEIEVDENVENPEEVAWEELSGIIENAMFSGYRLGDITHIKSETQRGEDQS